MLISRLPTVGALSDNTPLMDDTLGSPGTGTLVARWDHVHPKEPPSPSPPSELGPLTCLIGLSVLQAVYSSAADSVAAANATNTTKLPCIGFVSSKPTPTSAMVQYEGTLTGFVGLTPNAEYYMDITDGSITSNVGAFVPGNVIQRVGIAQNTTTLVIILDTDFIVL